MTKSRKIKALQFSFIFFIFVISFNSLSSGITFQEFVVVSDPELDMVNPSSRSNTSGLTVIVWQQQMKNQVGGLVYANRYWIYGAVMNSNGNVIYGPFKVSKNPPEIISKFPLPDAKVSIDANTVIQYALVVDKDTSNVYRIEVSDFGKTYSYERNLGYNYSPLQIAVRQNGNFHDFAFTANSTAQSISKLRILPLDKIIDIPLSSSPFRVTVSEVITTTFMINELEHMIQEADEAEFEVSKKHALLNQFTAIYEVLKSNDNPQPIIALFNNLKKKIEQWVNDGFFKSKAITQMEAIIASIENNQ